MEAILTDVGTQGSVGRLMQSEWDYKPKFTNTRVNGLIMTIDSTVQPAIADAYVAGSTAGAYSGAIAKWNNGFRTYPNEVITAFLADLNSPAGTPSANSQPITWQATDSSAASHQLSIIAEGSASSLIVQREDGQTVNFGLQNGYFTSIGFRFIPTTVALLPSCTSANVDTLRAVSDATTAIYNGIVTGGGSLRLPVYCNGTNWLMH